MDTFKSIFTKIKAFFAWVWEYVITLVTLLVGFIILLPDLMDAMAGINFVPLLPADIAIWAGTATAALKVFILFCVKVYKEQQKQKQADGINLG